MAPPPVFISYSHADEHWKKRLVEHLGVLGGSEPEIWDDRRIAAGANWQAEIDAAIRDAQVAVLLITASFLTSKFIQSTEIPLLRERQRTGGLRVIPVIARPCAWKKNDWLASLQCRPWDGRALSQLKEDEVDTALVALAEEINGPEPLRAGDAPRPLSAAGKIRRRLQWPLLLSGLLTVAVVAVVISRLVPASPQIRTPEYQGQLDLGLAALRRKEGARAEHLLAQALEEGDLPEAHAARAEALNLLGRADEAVAEATRAEEGIKALPDRDALRLRVQAQVDLTMGRWKKAEREYSALHHESPLDVEPAVGLARATLEQGRYDEALALVAGMRSFAEPRLDLIAAQAAGNLGRWEDQEDAASRALERSKDKPLLTAEALLLRGLAFSDLGRSKEALTDLSEAQNGARQNLALAGDVQDALGSVEFKAKHFRQARVHYEQALTLFERGGDSGNSFGEQLNIATISMELGELGKARNVYKALLRKAGPGDKERLCGNLGLALLRLGDVAAASKQLENAYNLSTEGGNAPARAVAACNFARIQGLQLLYDPAVSSLSDCRQAAFGDPDLEALALSVEGHLFLLRGKTEKARKAFEDSLVQRRLLGNTQEITDNILSLAEVLLETSHPNEARQRADEALRGLSDDDNPDQRAAAQVLRARAALALGQKEEARSFLQQAAQRAVRSEEMEVRIRYRLAAAQLAEQSGDLKEAGRFIEKTREETAGSHHRLLAIDCAIAAGALALRQGNPEPLAQARELAQALGYELAVARADRLLTRDQARVRVP